MTQTVRRHSALLLIAVVALAPTTGSHAQAMPKLSLDRPVWVSSEPFTSVTAVHELPSGGVLVADLDDRRVVLVTNAGRTMRTVGRNGAGPNEYNSPRRLIALPGDTTLLLDRDAHRYLLLDRDGRIVDTRSVPTSLDAGAEFLRGADPQGRLYYTEGFLPRSANGSTVVVRRWDRRTARAESVATVMATNPRPFTLKLPDGATGTGRRVMPFSPMEDWIVAPSGRVALVRTSPYRVDWRELDGRLTIGTPVKFTPVPVTEADRKAREPNGPPFRLEYPTTKPAFRDGTLVVDEQDRVYVRRERAASATQALWDLFDARGRHLGSMSLPVSKQIVAISPRFIYVARTDADDLRWLEAYAR